jgi:hypothetical protein
MKASMPWKILWLLPLTVFALSCSCARKPQVSEQKEQRAATGYAMSGSWGIDVAKLPGTRFQATFQDNVVRIDADTVKRTARGVNKSHDIFFFDNVPELREKVVPGKVVLFEGFTFKRIQAIAIDGSRLIVGTENASLTELLKNADIEWHAPINFQELHAQKMRARAALARAPKSNVRELAKRIWQVIEPRVYADEGENEAPTEKEEDGWDTKFSPKFSPDRLDFQVDIKRKGGLFGIADIDADLSGKGYIQNFETSLSMAVNNGNMDRFDFSNKNVNGTVDFNWTVGVPDKPGEMGEERIKLPSLMTTPLIVGGIPFTLEIGEALLFHPAFNTKLQIAKGAFHVDYNGVTGLKVSSGNGSAEGQNESQATADSSIQTSTANSPLAAFGLVVAIALPRFELKTGAEEFVELVPDSVADYAAQLLEKTKIGHYIHKAVKNVLETGAAASFQVIISTTASHSGNLSLVPCQRFTMHVEGQVKAEAKILGISVPKLPDVPFEKPYKVFEKDVDLPVPNAKICTG